MNIRGGSAVAAHIMYAPMRNDKGARKESVFLILKSFFIGYGEETRYAEIWNVYGKLPGYIRGRYILWERKRKGIVDNVRSNSELEQKNFY